MRVSDIAVTLETVAVCTHIAQNTASLLIPHSAFRVPIPHSRLPIIMETQLACESSVRQPEIRTLTLN